MHDGRNQNPAPDATPTRHWRWMFAVAVIATLITIELLPSIRLKPLAMSVAAKTSAGYSPTVRVNLTSQARRSVELRIDGAFSVRPVGDRNIVGFGKKLKQCKVSSTESGIRIDDTVYPLTRLEIVPDRSPNIWVNDRKYRGTIRVFRQSGGSIIVVNALPMDDYIASVVNGEMPMTFGKSARQAQAIVARTYALSQMKRRHPTFDVYSTARSQKYIGYQYHDSKGRLLAGETTGSRAIAQETSGVVCVYQGKIFTTYYSAVCGGKTAPGQTVFPDAAAPLKSVKCNYCQEADLYRWQRDYDNETISSKLAGYLSSTGSRISTVSQIQPRQLKDQAVPEFDVSDGKNKKRVSAVVLRRELTKLHSPYFQVERLPNGFRFKGRGHGHTVGLCQWGAAGQAKSGRSAVQILEYYYPGSHVLRLQSSSRDAVSKQ